MSQNKTVIQLNDSRVTSLTSPHADLPDNMKMSAQLIVGENVFLQTMPVALEHDEMSWKLAFGCTTETEGTRLVGYVEIRRDKILGSMETNSCTFELELKKVNPDGPSLRFRAGFSVSEFPYPGVSGLALVGLPDNKSELSTVTSVKGHGIEKELQKMYDDSRKARLSIEVPQLVVMHERILLCYQSNDNRAQWLNVLGDILWQSYQASGNADSLNQAVCAYNDAVRDDPGPIIYLEDLGRSLRHRFQWCGCLPDINRSVMLLEVAVQRTLPGDTQEPSRLNELGNSLLRRFKRLGSLDDLNQSVLRFEAAVILIPDGHPNKPSLLNNLGSSLSRRFQRDGHLDKPSLLNNLGNSLLGRFERLGCLDDLKQSVLRLEAALILTPDGHPDMPSRLSNLGRSLLSCFKRLGSLDDLNKSVSRFEAAVTLTPDGHPDKPSWLNNLGSSLLSCFERVGDLDDLNQAVSRFEAAVTLTPDGHPGKPSWLNNLGSSLTRRFQRLGDLDDLNQSVSRLEAAVNLTQDDHPDKPSLLNNLGNTLLGRFKRIGGLDDLNQSVLSSDAAVNITPDGHPAKAGSLSHLGSSLLSRFERLGGLDDLNQSVLRFEAALTLTPDGHPDRPSRLSNLGNSLLGRFKQLGGLDDLNKSVSKFAAAVNVTPDGHPDKPSLLSNLGKSLLGRFERLGDLDDLNQAVSTFKAAVDVTPDGHPAIPSLLSNLGSSLSKRFQRLGGLDDLHRSVSSFEAAVNLTEDGHPDKPSLLNNLGNSLLGRFERLSDLNDLNQCVLRLEVAVTLTPDGHLDKPSWLSNLGNSLSRRFEQLGDLNDLNQSVSMLEAAVTLIADGHPDKPLWLSNLGHSLRKRFERLGDVNDLNQSVLINEAAVTLIPDGHPNKPSQLSKLGISLLGRFERLGDLDDLNQSVLRLEAAVALTPDGHPNKASLLNNLGNSLSRHFKRLGDLNDLTQSVSSLEAAVTIAPNGNPDKPMLLNNLGNSLHQRFEQLHDPQDSQQLVLHYTLASCSATGPASIRFHAATQWAKHAHIHEPTSILRAYSTAIELLPELAWLGLSITDRHHQLSQAGEVVRNAASAAIAVHDYKKAVEWLDQGRSVIWSQLLNLCTPVDELSQSHPNFADRLVSLSTSLATAGTRRNSVADPLKPESLDSIAKQSHAFVLDRNDVLRQIRELPGFERFLLSKPFSELSPAAKMGPVALLNISAYGCDALILMPAVADEIIHVPLSHFTVHEAQALAKSLASIVGTPGRSERLFGFREGDMAPDDKFSHILSTLWLKIVRPILSVLAINSPVGENLGRIWWCPTGPLAFLPIHAAGLYGEDQAFGSKLSDFLISSYTPSLTALIQGFRPNCESQAELQLLAVTQPSAKGQSYLPGTHEEIKCIQQHIEGKKVHLQWLDEEMATIDKVQEGMTDSRWVHFACHGVQSDSPIESALLLAGSSRLTLSNIIQLNLPNADLAFLSACQTATGSQELQDESVHLTAGMLLAGYRGVIGTMWSIDDKDAPQVAGDVYAHILEASPPDPTRAAQALHLAVKKLREQPGLKKSFLHWVPFIFWGLIWGT
ncbi:TPR-like protein [Mycena rebaudengoi]|nr:TPR-like protein [Mycena rebaudengoi]